MIPPTEAIAIAADGARIAYRTLGTGPGLAIVHGAMQSAASQLELAELLAERRSVHLIDRRGHGASSPQSGAPHTQHEVDDLLAVLAATGSRAVLGVSSGAIIAARAGIASADIDELVLFEPPLVIDGSADLGLLPRFDAAVAEGRLPTAMALAMKIAQMGPTWMFGLPVPVLAAASGRMLRDPEFAERARAVSADFGIVRENADRVDEFRAVSARTLVLSGSATRPYLKGAATALAQRISGARHTVLDGQWHSATQNRAERGRPELVAPHVLEFLGV